MRVPDLFPTLPDDIVRFIYQFAHLNMDDIIKLRLVCKNYKEIIDKYLNGRQERIKRLIQEFQLNMKDPIYADFTQQIEAIAPFSEFMFWSLKVEHLDRHLTLKNLTPEKLDRTFGYMLQNRALFKQIFPTAVPHAFTIAESDRVLKYRKYFVEYLNANFSTDDKYLQFYNLINTSTPLESETSPLGLSHFQEKYGNKEDFNLLNFFKNVSQFTRSYDFVFDSGLLNYPEVKDRRNQAYMMMFYASIVDLHLLTRAMEYLLGALLPGLKNSVFIYIISLLLAFYMRPQNTLSWTIIRYFDCVIYACPNAHNSLMDLRYLASDATLILITSFVHFMISVFGAIENRLAPRQALILRNQMLFILDRSTDERARLAEENRRRQLRRQGALENEEN